MLSTNLKHIEGKEEFEDLVKNNKNAMVCCGRMGPMCIPVYGIMENLESKYSDVQFRDMDFDIPVASVIREIPECASFMGLPFTVYFKDGKVVKATSSLQSEEQVVNILNEVF